MSVDLEPFVERIEALLRSHALGPPGAYRRTTLPAEPGGEASRDDEPNPYGCADAANLLYTIGRFPRDPAERAGWVATLRGLQDPASGMFCEASHHEIHTTAHCLAALELFDAGPAHPLAALAPLGEPGALERFLDALDWRGAPWTESHQGAGLYAARVLAGEASPDFQERYFAWLAAEVDPATGMLRRGCVDPDPAGGVFPHLAGSFHYLFNHEYARRPWPHAAAMVDTCLAIRATPFPLAVHVWFGDVDWVYCLWRAARQSGHRIAEVRTVLAAFAAEYAAFALGLDEAACDDLHTLFGVTCTLAELQQAVPGALRTRRPLRLVLDRRPFI